MNDTPNSHAVAVKRFIEIMAAPHCGEFKTPRALSTAQGIPVSSGYRAIAALEAEGMLRRDSSGAYLAGERAYRVGLNAFGLGTYAITAGPILDRLRHAAGETAFLGVQSGTTLSVGPFSVGRGAFAAIPTQSPHEVSNEAILGSPGIARCKLIGCSYSGLVLTLGMAPSDGDRALLGLLTSIGRSQAIPPAWVEALVDAAERFHKAARAMAHEA